LLASLESRQRYAPFSPVHSSKLREEDRFGVRVRGTHRTYVRDLSEVSLEELLRGLDAPDLTWQQREAAACAVKAKLQQMGIGSP
jgi:hypothetical protein